MAVTVSGMFGKVDGQIHTYFVDSPVVIDISGLEWPGSSPFNIVRVQVVYDGNIVGNFHSDTGGQSSTSFDISSALRAIWADYDYSWEVRAAQRGLSMSADWLREHRSYSLRIYTEYLDNYGEFVSTQCADEDGHTDIPGGQCAIGGFTEWERSTIPSKEAADVSYREHENLRYGDASTKPTDIPERIGSLSPTSWVDVNGVNVNMNFWPVGATPASDSQERHAPIVLRDSVPYVDFIFLNRRRNRIKVLRWEPGGLVIYSKRLEEGTFRRPSGDAASGASLGMEWRDLVIMVEGIRERSGGRRKRMLGPPKADSRTTETM